MDRSDIIFVSFASQKKIFFLSQDGNCEISQPENNFKLTVNVNEFVKLEQMLEEVIKIFECFTSDICNESSNIFFNDIHQIIYWKIIESQGEKKLILIQNQNNDLSQNVIFSLNEFYILLKGLSLLLISVLPFQKNDEKTFMIFLIRDLSLNDFEDKLIDQVIKYFEKNKSQTLFSNINSFTILSNIIFYADYIKIIKHLQLLSNFI